MCSPVNPISSSHIVDEKYIFILFAYNCSHYLIFISKFFAKYNSEKDLKYCSFSFQDCLGSWKNLKNMVIILIIQYILGMVNAKELTTLFSLQCISG